MVVAEYLSDLKSVISEEKIIESYEKHPLGNSGGLTVYPTTEDEIIHLLKFASERNLKITLMGAGTKRGFGGVNETADILLSLFDYRGIVEHTIGDMTLTVKAGTPFGELQQYLAEHNQKISLDPTWPDSSTIGGIVAANESGPKRLGYGSARDAIIGLRTVYPDGTVIRSGGKVVKNVAGYDMNKLFIGSMGTLGVLSEITLKLRPLPQDEKLVLLSFQRSSFQEIKEFASRILDTMLEPVSLELLNPTVSNRLYGEKAYSLAISFEDVENSVDYQVFQISTLLPLGVKMVTYEKNEASKFWSKFYKLGPEPLTLEKKITDATLKVGLVNLDVISILRESEILQDKNNVRIEAHGGLGHGLCIFHISGAEEDVLKTIKQLRTYANNLGGYAVIKHLPYELRKTINVWGELPSYFFLLKGIKGKIDPNNLLNYKRYVGGI
ncbi:FAD-binding oxidoreductase [Bacillus pinisoli]|uniref:FAD-binding oxidoreductase n=1 Tax=Bacillus pinisoli TaxID=2901866 RepID=UPI001FF34644